MVAKKYIPERGDLIWVQFNPQTGHEQAGLRPALVVSPLLYNKAAGLALMCPITSQIKGYPFEVNLPKGLKISGAVLSDQIKSLDWKMRNARLIAKAPLTVLDEVVVRIQAILASYTSS